MYFLKLLRVLFTIWYAFIAHQLSTPFLNPYILLYSASSGYLIRSISLRNQKDHYHTNEYFCLLVPWILHLGIHRCSPALCFGICWTCLCLPWKFLLFLKLRAILCHSLLHPGLLSCGRISHGKHWIKWPCNGVWLHGFLPLIRASCNSNKTWVSRKTSRIRS